MSEAVRIRRLYAAEDAEGLASTINNLAGVEKELGRHAEAVERYQEALDMKSELPDHFTERDLALARKNLGTGLRAAGRLEEAVDVFREALDVLDAKRDRAGVELHLGGALRELGEHAEARERLESALSVYGTDSLKSGDVLLELGLLDHVEGRLDVAGERLRRVLEIRRGKLGDVHPEVGEALVTLARTLRDSGDVEGATAAAREASGIFRER